MLSLALPAYKTSPAAIVITTDLDGTLRMTSLSDPALRKYAYGCKANSRFTPASFAKLLAKRSPAVILRGSQNAVKVPAQAFIGDQVEKLRDLGCFVFDTVSDFRINNEDPELTDFGYLKLSKEPTPSEYLSTDIMPKEYGFNYMYADREVA